MDPEPSIEEARRAHEDELMAKPNVTGVGIGKRGDRDVIKVFVTRKVPAAELAEHELVPRTVGGYPTDVEEIGVVTAQDS